MSQLRRHTFPALLACTVLLSFALGVLIPTPSEARNQIVNCGSMQDTHINYYSGLPYTQDTLIGGKIIWGCGFGGSYSWGITFGSHTTSYCTNCNPY